MVLQLNFTTVSCIKYLQQSMHSAKTLFLYDSNIVLLQKYRLQDMKHFLHNKT